ncbi:PAS domain-containing protein [Methylomonas koyamae]|uniref:PAS domain-containing protein n=1 Tax=Methylomonas koyamae TaxID=702114 RepID=UPI000A97A94A|nr:PAS domain-containing protein [Methylomonas koyamae]
MPANSKLSAASDFSPCLNPKLRALLQDRERMLSMLMSNLQGMVYCCLLDADWTMVFVSEGCRALTGYSSEELLFNKRISYEELTLAEDRLWVRRLIEKAAHARKKFDLEYRIVHADGSVHWVQESGFPLFNDHSELVALEGFIQDVTARKRSEQAARDAEARYRSIFETPSKGFTRPRRAANTWISTRRWPASTVTHRLRICATAFPIFNASSTSIRKNAAST